MMQDDLLLYHNICFWLGCTDDNAVTQAISKVVRCCVWDLVKKISKRWVEVWAQLVWPDGKDGTREEDESIAAENSDETCSVASLSDGENLDLPARPSSGRETGTRGDDVCCETAATSLPNSPTRQAAAGHRGRRDLEPVPSLTAESLAAPAKSLWAARAPRGPREPRQPPSEFLFCDGTRQGSLSLQLLAATPPGSS